MPHKSKITLAATLVLFLSGCGTEVGQEPEPTNPPSESAASSEPTGQESVDPGTETPSTSEETSQPETAEPAAQMQEETCDWDRAPLPASPADGAPTAPGDGELAEVIIGAWQHTQIDDGNGFEELDTDTDIRFVFPSSSRLLYCQDIADIMPQAENLTDIEIEGMEILIPEQPSGYTVDAWDTDTMVWINNLDKSLYLLERR